MSAASMTTAATTCMSTATTAVRWRCMSAAAAARWRCVRRVHMPCTGMGNARVATSAVIVVRGSSVAAVPVITSAPLTAEAMCAPSVAIAPTGPRAHAQKNAVVEVSRPIEAHGRAAVRRIVVIAVGAVRLDAD
jgi:hypothetical protein